MLEGTRDLMATLMDESSGGPPTPGISRAAGRTRPQAGNRGPTPELAKVQALVKAIHGKK